MHEPTVFDEGAASGVFHAKKEALTNIVKIGRSHSIELNTALDLGCGIGLFSAQLAGLQFDVTGLEARLQNVEEAQRRYPDITFRQRSVEAPLADFGKFDLVLCYGLLYHLENPIAALRSLRALTGKVAILETQAPAMGRPMGVLRAEPLADDQSVTGMSLRMSREAVLKALFQIGFPHIYRYESSSGARFRGNWQRKPRRVILVLSETELDHDEMKREVEPEFDVYYDYTRLGKAHDLASRALRKLRSRF